MPEWPASQTSPLLYHPAFEVQPAAKQFRWPITFTPFNDLSLQKEFRKSSGRDYPRCIDAFPRLPQHGPCEAGGMKPIRRRNP